MHVTLPGAPNEGPHQRRRTPHRGQALLSRAAEVRILCASLRASALVGDASLIVVIIHIVALELGPVYPAERHTDRLEIEG